MMLEKNGGNYLDGKKNQLGGVTNSARKDNLIKDNRGLKGKDWIWAPDMSR